MMLMYSSGGGGGPVEKKKKSGFGKLFRHVKKILNFSVLANIKSSPAKFFNFDFYCKPDKFLS